jgi:hypothetical protein
MKKENLQILGLILFFLVLIIAFHFIGQRQDSENDVTLCRDIFNGLLEGRQLVQDHIAWEKLNALGLSVGATYNRLPNKQEKSDYRREWIKNLSLGFKQGGGTPLAFTNWRVYRRAISTTVVAADYKEKSKVILFSLSGSGYNKKKLISIQWENTSG